MLRLWNASVARRFQAKKTSLVASPLTPKEISHSLKISAHLLQARTVQLPIRLSSLAILINAHINNKVSDYEGNTPRDARWSSLAANYLDAAGAGYGMPPASTALIQP